MAFACGRGPRLTPVVDGVMPLIEEERLVHLGSRALDEAEREAMGSSQMKMASTSRLKRTGVGRESGDAAKWLADRCDWIICHLDVDVLDPSWMPSVNYPTKNGLTPGEVVTILRSIARTGKVAVLDVAAYNAELDRDGRSAGVVADILSRSFLD